MKKLIFHSVPFVISMIWLVTAHQTYNPLFLKGPDFLKFYLILLLVFYASVFSLKLFGETISKTKVYFLILIFVVGIVKLIRGMILEKPVGFLMMILLTEFIVSVFFILSKFKQKIN